MKEKQFDKFWEIKCPYCGKKVDLEILINLFSKEQGVRIRSKKK